jgi:hypothetical protein
MLTTSNDSMINIPTGISPNMLNLMQKWQQQWAIIPNADVYKVLLNCFQTAPALTLAAISPSITAIRLKVVDTS